jgi:hypothetical protein
MSRNAWRLAVLAAAALFAACSDAPIPTAPTLPDDGPVLEIWNPPIVVDVMRRTEPLAAPLSTSALVGRPGAVMHLQAAGMTLYIPPNALRRPTQITVTALPGSEVAYTFEPHGLVFRKAIYVIQDLKITEAFLHPEERADLEGAYFADPGQIDPATGTARVSETRPTYVDVNGWRAAWSVEHFSGYLLSRRGGYIGSSGSRAPTGRGGF